MVNGLGERQLKVNIPIYTRVYFYKYTTILKNSQGGSVQSLGILSYVLWGGNTSAQLINFAMFSPAREVHIFRKQLQKVPSTVSVLLHCYLDNMPTLINAMIKL